MDERLDAEAARDAGELSAMCWLAGGGAAVAIPQLLERPALDCLARHAWR